MPNCHSQAAAPSVEYSLDSDVLCSYKTAALVAGERWEENLIKCTVKTATKYVLKRRNVLDKSWVPLTNVLSQLKKWWTMYVAVAVVSECV